MNGLVDVIAVEIAAPHARRVMARGLTPESAETFIRTAVMRRGVEREFFKAEPASMTSHKHEGDGR